LETIEGTEEQADLLERIDRAAAEGKQDDDFPFAEGAPDDKEAAQYKTFETDDKETIFSDRTHGMPSLERDLGIKRGEPATLNQAINRANPYYNPDNTFTQSNCASSALALECQMNGYNANAKISKCNIDNALSVFDFKKGDVERASERGWLEMEDRMLESDFPVGSRFIISQKWKGGEENDPWHNYNAIKISNSTIRYADGQKRMNDISIRRKYLRNNVGMDEKGYGLIFARVDNKKLKEEFNYSNIVSTSSQKLDNVLKNDIIINNGKDKMTKEEALEILKKHLKPVKENGITLLRHIGEYVGESKPDKADFIFTVYYYSSVSPIDPTYAFYYFVNKETKEIIRASAPEDDDAIKWVQENCEKIDISVT